MKVPFGEEGEAPDTAQVIDLVEALRRSVEASRAKRTGGTTSTAESGTKKPPAKKGTAAAKKTGAKKASTKKSAAKKSA